MGREWAWRWRGYCWSWLWGGTSLCSVTIIALSGVGFNFQVAGVAALRVGPQMALFPLSLCFPLSLHQDPCFSSGGSAEASVPCAGSQLVSATDRGLSCFQCTLPVQVPAIVSLALLRCRLLCKSPLSLTANHSPQASATPALLWSHAAGQSGLLGLSMCIGG